VRIVTPDARLERVVKTLDDLGKTGGPRLQVLVTGQTSGPSLTGHQGSLGLEVFGVGRRRTVANLTGERAMVGPSLEVALLVVALDADLPTGITNRLSDRDCDRFGPIMPGLPKGCGNKPTPRHDQKYRRRRQENSKAKDLIRNSPDLHPRDPLAKARGKLCPFFFTAPSLVAHRDNHWMSPCKSGGALSPA
jgi:hypothetical protein